MLGMNAAWLRLRKGMLCLLFFMLLPAAHAVSMPAAAVASQKTQPAAEAAPHEPTVEEKRRPTARWPPFWKMSSRGRS